MFIVSNNEQWIVTLKAVFKMESLGLQVSYNHC